ncbi:MULTISPECIES: hypothetical protein [unclassified Nocardioides]|uniref:hypothetical protein n=1 Tax=unclassified Nocardioides TaxID=2615069 RepID=UPI0009F038C1|nr:MULTISPECIES: hypothetical protein [unclassified Nocardioides]GAW52575.1 uncharacterized protein PD653B2_4933 [Nocardioides sp. PD653-B2]GAW57586.1 uncharacterized protein PD653_5031 [Nocardioides sp. PD653]
MTTLHDRLADLAAEAPTGGPTPDLWSRGRRYQRRRRAAVLVAAVVVLVVGVVGVVLRPVVQDEPAPVTPTDGFRLPNRFYEPSPRTPTTHDAGPLGPMVAVMGSEGGLVGVSASTGAYRRLDLPGWSDADEPLGSSDVSLSADGLRLGYWYVEDGTVRGAAVYDAVTDEVMRHDVESDHGVMPDGMTWVGDRLWFSAPLFDDNSGTSATSRVTYVWQTRTDAVREVPAGRSPSFGNAAATDDRVVESGGGTVDLYSPDGEPVRSLRVEPSIGNQVVVSPDGSRFAAMLDPDPSSFDDTQHGVVVLSPRGRDGTAAHRVPGLLTNEVVGWRGSRQVVVRTFDLAAYQAVDVETGRAEPLTVPGSSWVPGFQVAQDAWSAPTYDAPAPPTPPDPRWPWVGSGAGVLLGGLALVLWRRRVRA